MVDLGVTLLQSVTLAHDRVDQIQLSEVFHDWETFGVDGFRIVTSIELSQGQILTRLVDIDQTCIQHLANSCRALALQTHICSIFVPINEIRPAIVSRVAHVTEGELSE